MRETRKRAISVLLAIILLAATLPVYAQATGTSGLTTEAAQAYLDVLNDCVGTYGSCTATDSSKASTTGLTHSSLVDFDGDGVPELYMLYVSELGSGGATLVEEIWQCSGTSAERVYQNVFDSMYSGSESTDAAYYCLLSIDGKVVRVCHWESFAPNFHGVNLEVSQLQGGGMTESLMVAETCYAQQSNEGAYRCVVNGSLVDEQSFPANDSFADHRRSDIYAYFNRYPVWPQNAVIFWDGDFCKWTKATAYEQLREALATAVNTTASPAAQSPQQIAAQLPYTGDVSKMNMSAAQAEAFAKVLRGYSQSLVKAALFDGGNGVPILWVIYGDIKAQHEMHESNGGWWSLDLSSSTGTQLLMWNGGAAVSYTESVGALLLAGENGIMYDTIFDITTDGWNDEYYRLSNGIIAPRPFLKGYCRQQGYEFEGTNKQDALAVELDGKKYNEDMDLYETINAKLAPDAQWPLVAQGDESTLSASGNWVDGSAVAATLESYAAAKSAKARLEAAKHRITIDYTRTASFRSDEDYSAYLEELLKSTGSKGPSDADKSALAAYIENALTELSSGTVKAKNNKLTLKAKNVEGLVKNAQAAKDKLMTVLTENAVGLNKSLAITVRVDGTSIDLSKPMEITLDKSLKNSLNGAELYIILRDGAHALRISDNALQDLFDEHGELTLQIEQMAQGKYKLSFCDAKGELLPRLCAPVTICLPSAGSYSTVFASYPGGSDNWGGQYDGVNGAISFETVFSGDYEIMDNTLQISDISGLSEEMTEAIRFMASKGYFAVNESGEFLPQTALTRYDFTSALVGMFFALDRELSTDFPDVAQNSPYYAQVASAQASGIINGFDDGTFGGERNITTEQVLALAARTLADKKGYSYPENTAKYLNFSGGERVSEWAKKAVVLAAREGVLATGEGIAPTADISRGDAALYLYRMFMLLYEVSPVAIGGERASSGALSPFAACCMAAALLFVAAALAIYWRGRLEAEKRRLAEDSQGQSAEVNKKIALAVITLCALALVAFGVMTALLIIGGASGKRPLETAEDASLSALSETVFAEPNIGENGSRFASQGTYSGDISNHLESNRCTEALAYDGDFVYPDSNSRLLTRDEVEKLSPHECIIARTEIFARYGLIHSVSRINNYFNSKSWYSGTKTMDEVVFTALNSVEQQNVMTIKAWQEENGFELS